ncbi:DUF5709 domain-containing protein [Pseudonocardia abyssalis]|uniref:DUF5709 domain-containing protein n=1 Tax=Pseudonocardia abyssalis TaxID=2792008 RepID=A0ABS6USN4_9PSEU|nr:DUF5709 domain-containing protein [Pseudonocardia abyssalis]MBW0117503.1 hypothetical protein [Pseudonocardia abyssalis]MBW0135265.1 hypothetical protein [Pseudonocardia abyssalis]
MPDFDDQSAAPDLGAAVQLDNAETLDGAAGGPDALDAGYIPPDRPYALDEDAHETLDERLAAEEPEQAPDADADRSGRLTAVDGDDTEATDVGVDGGAASAEEAAVHDVDGDTRVDGEPSVADDPSLVDPEVDAEIAEADADRRGVRDAAAGIDDAVDGSAAGASGRIDAGPFTGL